MSQFQQHQIENEFAPVQIPYLTILKNLLNENKNHQFIKNRVKAKLQKIQNLTYSAIAQSQQKYLQKYGALNYDQEIFYYIEKIMNQKKETFLYSIYQGPVIVKSNIKPPPEPQPQPTSQMIQQFQNVMSNVDLPISLFKRNDNYWSINNPKTLEANQYLKQLRQKELQIKENIKKRKQQQLKGKQSQRKKMIDYLKKQQEKQKQFRKKQIQQKLQQLKKNSQSRQKSISQSIEYLKQRGKPLYQKIQKQYHLKFQIPQIQQKKKKMEQVKKMMRAVPLQQINSHRQKYQKIKAQNQPKKIFNQPSKVYKSQFYHSIQALSSSRFNQMSNNVSLYQKKLEFAKMVKQNYKPSIDQQKQKQIQNRIKIMNKKRKRKIKKKQQQKKSDQDDSDQQQEQQQEQQSQPQPEQSQQDDQEDDQYKPKKQVDDQYEPDQKQRYKLGLNYLQIARKLAAKKKAQQNKQKRTLSNLQHNSPNLQATLNNNKFDKKYLWVSKYDEQQKKSQNIKYRDYLKQLRKDNQSNKYIDTSRIKKQISKSIDFNTNRNMSASRYDKNNRRTINIDDQILYQTNFQNKIRSIQQRAKNQQQLLKYKRIKQSQKVNKKVQIDNALVDTIKARLHLMNKSIQK